jgi:hypothetical protein
VNDRLFSFIASLIGLQSASIAEGRGKKKKLFIKKKLIKEKYFDSFCERDGQA